MGNLNSGRSYLITAVKQTNPILMKSFLKSRSCFKEYSLNMNFHFWQNIYETLIHTLRSYKMRTKFLWKRRDMRKKNLTSEMMSTHCRVRGKRRKKKSDEILPRLNVCHDVFFIFAEIIGNLFLAVILPLFLVCLFLQSWDL